MRNELLSNCLYFTLNKFTRKFNATADEIFSKVGLAPNYAFVLFEIDADPGINSCKLAKQLALSPSTITRFIDKLIIKNLVSREISGKNSFLKLTDNGKELISEIKKAWHELYLDYCEKLSKDEAVALTKKLDELSEMI